MAVNWCAGRLRLQEWNNLQNNLTENQGRIRRTNRRALGIAPYQTEPLTFAVGCGEFGFQKPWAPVPRKKLIHQISRKHRCLLVNEIRTSSLIPIAGYEEGVLGPQAAVDPVQLPYGICNHRKRKMNLDPEPLPPEGMEENVLLEDIGNSHWRKVKTIHVNSL